MLETTVVGTTRLPRDHADRTEGHPADVDDVHPVTAVFVYSLCLLIEVWQWLTKR